MSFSDVSTSIISDYRNTSDAAITSNLVANNWSLFLTFIDLSVYMTFRLLKVLTSLVHMFKYVCIR